MQLFYVQKIECNFIKVDHSQPALKTWNTELLKMSETAEFSYLVDKSHCETPESVEEVLNVTPNPVDLKVFFIPKSVCLMKTNLFHIFYKLCNCFQGKVKNTDKLDAIPVKKVKEASAEKGQNVTSEGNKLVCFFHI